jgi:hypothetical protein
VLAATTTGPSVFWPWELLLPGEGSLLMGTIAIKFEFNRCLWKIGYMKKTTKWVYVHRNNDYKCDCRQNSKPEAYCIVLLWFCFLTNDTINQLQNNETLKKTSHARASEIQLKATSHLTKFIPS